MQVVLQVYYQMNHHYMYSIFTRVVNSLDTLVAALFAVGSRAVREPPACSAPCLAHDLIWQGTCSALCFCLSSF